MIYYVRHGQTVWNRQQRLQGRGDSPLTLWGVQLAMAYGDCLRRALDAERDFAVHSSPMGRARQTAAIVADAIGVGADAVIEDELLAEHDIGSWGGLGWVEIERECGVSREALRDWDLRPPGGETRREMFERARRWLTRHDREHTAIIVSHGGFSRAFRAAFLGLAVEQAGDLPVHIHGRLYRLAEGSVCELVAEATPPPPEAALG
jgi:broad specificity phosphatase PhoE